MDYIKVALNHIEARRKKKFDPENYTTPDDLCSKMDLGRTYEVILQRIEDRMIHPFDVLDAHNGVISDHYSEMVKAGFLLFNEKAKSYGKDY